MVETLFLLLLYCEHLMPDTERTAQCMVDLHVCAYEAAAEYPDRSFEDRVDNCAESIGFDWIKDAGR